MAARLAKSEAERQQAVRDLQIKVGRTDRLPHHQKAEVVPFDVTDHHTTHTPRSSEDELPSLYGIAKTIRKIGEIVPIRERIAALLQHNLSPRAPESFLAIPGYEK
ncbi:hypothetical protein HDU90_009190 [Geranomyces variabilis]|nr:hypothetical protein HDU90_009190 [Geranomyces variabilis]